MNVSALPHRIAKRIRNEVFYFLVNKLRFNEKLRPLGVKKIVRMSSPEAKYYELGPPQKSVVKVDEKFLSNWSPYMKPVVSYQTDGDFMVTLRNGRIFCADPNNIAVISGDNYVLDEVSFQWANYTISDVKGNRVFKVKGFPKPKKYKGRVFSLLSGWAAKNYYYHWVFETIPKLHILKSSGDLDKVDYFLIPGMAFRYQREYLDHFGITPDKIINEEEVHHIQADELMVTSHVKQFDHHPKWICDFLYDSFTSKIRIGLPEKLVYVARGDAARSRRVANEPQLIEMLKSYGFEAYYLSSMSVKAQVALFNSARVIVGVHGGGLSNYVFCRPGVKVLEFYPDQYIRPIFLDVAEKRGLEYHYMVFPADGKAENTIQGEALGLTADIEAIRNKVAALLA
ncbi:MAG: glycosyltransferase family 61 protein [Chryseolinea sp.]